MKLLTLFVFLFSAVSLSGQIKGIVTDQNGEPLPYTSIYVKNTSTGTSTNAEGRYELKLEQGSYELVFQFISYKTQSQHIEVGAKPIALNVVLQPESALLQEVIIAADAEDPAYAVIRNAIKKRPYYNSLTEAYSCDVYVKGNQKVIDAPEKIMGIKVGDMEGLLDSNRQGIVYLSESISRLHYQKPGNYKEIVTSSKISGDDKGYSFNSAKEMEFNFYDNTIELQRNMITPIANNALNFYRYKLLGTFYDDDNRLINKIEVTPKRASDPAFYGTIYITEDLWNIYALELGVTSKAAQVYVLDSLTFNQVFIPLEEPDVWLIFNNTITFQLSAFGFELAGVFGANYSNYNLKPSFEDKFFDNNVHVVEKESNERDSAFWAEIRPVPLSIEEVIDYAEKDSIQEVRDSPAYKDSIGRIRNKFEIGDIIGGYSYHNWRTNNYWNVNGPLNALSFNTVQGLRMGIDFSHFNYFDEEETQRLLYYGRLDYGFSEKVFRAKGRMVYRPSRLNNNEYSIGLGSDVLQFNREDPISTTYNMFFSLLGERNLAKYFGRKFIEIEARSELAPGIVLNSGLTWEERSPLTNHSDYKLFDDDGRIYTSNNPEDPTNFEPAFDEHQALLVDLNATIRFKQKYFLYPDRRFNAGSVGPSLSVAYRGAFDVGGADVRFHKIAASLRDQIQAGVFGSLDFYLNGGVFFSQQNMTFVDYRHFMGTEVFVAQAFEYGRRFLQLPYYSNSTNDSYVQAHIQHHFNGYILDKIPGINNLGLNLVAGAKYLHASPNPDYYEFHIGIDNIGYKLFRFLRFDTVLSVTNGQTDVGFRLGLKI